MHHTEFLFDLADLPPAVKYEKLFENLPILQENIPLILPNRFYTFSGLLSLS